MSIKKIDKNFNDSFICPEDTEWFSVLEEPFSVHGIYYSEGEKQYRRLPEEVAEATNEGVAFLATDTAGGRLRFETDSPYVVLRAEEPFDEPFSHMTICGQFGFSLFTDKGFVGTYMPQYRDLIAADPSLGGTDRIVFDGIKYPRNETGGAYAVTLFFPLYSAVRSVCIGLRKGSILRRSKPYKHRKPVLFYGSSITQGGCASKPGDDYISRLSRLLDTDFINLGFSGRAFGEKVMAEYLASRDPSVFVLDYDHNAPDAKHLENTHYSFYETVRKAHRNTPIVLTTMPTIEGYGRYLSHKPRREVILKNYQRARSMGDNNVYLIDCYGCFGKEINGECGTVDDCHPDSLGFLRMAERVYPVLDNLLNERGG